MGLMLGYCSGNMPFAWAQAKGPSTQSGKKPVPVTRDPVMTEFDKHLQAGKEAVDTNRWDTARQEFLKAHELKPDHAEAVARLADAEMATGRHREAVEHLEFFLDHATGIGAPDRKAAEELLIEARSKLAIVTITVDKPGAKISVDGRILGESPLANPVLVDSGHRRFEAEGPGGQDRVDMDLEPGTKPTIKLVLKALKPDKIVVPESGAWRTPVLITGLGLGVVGIGLGAGFIIASSQKNAEAIALTEQLQESRETSESICPPNGVDPECANLAALQSRRDTFGNVALAGFIVGGVAAVGTLAVWLTAPKKTPAIKKKESILVLPAPNGVFVTGTF